MLSFFPRGVLDEILNLIESVSEDFPSYSFNIIPEFCFIWIILIPVLFQMLEEKVQERDIFCDC